MTPTRAAAREVGGRARRAAAATSVDELLGARRRRRGRDLHADRHPRRPDRRRGRGGQGDLLREADLAGPGRRSTARWPPSRTAGVAVPDRLQPPLRPRPRSPCAQAVADGDDRRRRTSCASPAATRRRRRWSTCAASGGIFLDMTIHDFDMARFVTGSEIVEVLRARRACASTRPSPRPATSTPPWSRSRTPTAA